jgi:hypothetical protein
MRRILFLIVVAGCFVACGPKSYYQTSQGKKKQKYYNDIQFGKDPHPTPPKSLRKKKN